MNSTNHQKIRQRDRAWKDSDCDLSIADDISKNRDIFVSSGFKADTSFKDKVDFTA